MDVFDINVNEITRQYLEYIRLMKELDLEIAGEFVAMAATLIHIKSRMLLPQYNDTGEIVETEDPRKELVSMLLEYQTFQEAAKQLYGRPLLGRDVFSRGVREDFLADDDGAVVLEDDGLFSLINAYRRVVRKAQRAVHKVRTKVQSIASRIFELKDSLTVGTRVVLTDLMGVGAPKSRTQLLVTFLSMLELGRMGFVTLFQAETYGDIHIELMRPIERNVLERVQEFESGDAESIASSIINSALAKASNNEQDFEPSETVVAADLDEEIAESGATDEEILAAELEFEKQGDHQGNQLVEYQGDDELGEYPGDHQGDLLV
jgi:segregation and condensation protein A